MKTVHLQQDRMKLKELIEYIQKQNVHTIKMIYGQSMGAEIAIELFKQLEKTNISVEYCF